jgi:diadenosine tetraphosphate (Ap4A) HIT family hydrolase
MSGDCILCRLLAGDLPVTWVYEDAEVVAAMDIAPVNPGHVLVFPRRHEQLIADLDDATAQRLITVGNAVNRAIRASTLRCEGVNYFLADGQAALQEVPHVHLHVFPRFAGDPFRLDSGQVEARREELEHAAIAIRKAWPA